MFYISDNKEKIQLEQVKSLLKQTEWAREREEDRIIKTIVNSLCFGAYLSENDNQIAFARVVTDYATFYYICDVIVDKEFRTIGVGKALVENIINDTRLKNLKGILATTTARGFYEKYGFSVENEKYMSRKMFYGL